ncbi:hypothetical protein IMSHALPRED_008096 [Imshaugia aleurites]|uniref:Rab-GAP TBC domain-containing protein n=1 Tax=Imshaugia aleurites TaxID=172621 RepID=A0A8H3FYW9_9LECA|nr:hypothetical protein IMSHALPRED_008096 [Imshaugia aleurites]
MTFVDGRLGEPLAAAIDDGVALGKTLKKKKSLTRLFSTASRKSSRSRPPSPEYVHTPHTPHTPPIPQVPTHFWPLGPSGAPRIPSMSFDRLISEHIRDEQFVDMAHSDKLPGSPLAMSNTEETENTRSKATLKCESEPASRQSPVASKDHSRARASSVVRNGSSEKPIIPALPKGTKTGLRMPPAFTSVPRGRGLSVTAPNPKSSPAQPQLTRPSTAGGESNSKPTGKRRANSHRQVQGLPHPSFFDLEDFPMSPQRPWHATYSSDEVRSSFRSALTTSSSHIDTTSTERSSVLTKGTSITDSTIDQQSRPVSKVDSMTVDDAIDMYAAGFADDDETGPNDSRDTSMSEEERRRSMKIAEAIKDTIGDARPSRRPTTSQSTSSTARMSYDAIRRRSSQPPTILPPTSTRDQYGFLKANHHVSITQYDAWTPGYLLSQERRTKKWASYMREQALSTVNPTHFPDRSAKTQRYIRKGIPPAWRGSAWFFYAGGDAYLEKHAGLYTSLVSRSEDELSTTDIESIERDLHRTFPDNIHFKPDLRSSGSSAPELPLLSSLRHVLRAYALHNPRIGYCQSLNFLAGLLLLFLGEEKAFWMLHIITTVYLPGTHELSLEGTYVDLWILMVALKSTLPHTWAKVGAAGGSGDDSNGSARLPPISLCTTSWFMSLFIGTLPIETVLRVWDMLFYEGSRTLFRVALTIFKLGEQRIKDVSDPMELFQVVQGLPRGMLDAGAFMATVCRRGGVGGGWVEERRCEQRERFAKERAIAAGLSNATGADDVVPRDGTADERWDSARGRPTMTRMDSLWRRRKRKASVPVAVDGISGAGRDLLAL